MRRQLTENFYQDEFDCPCCGKNNINPAIVEFAQKMRTALGRPLKPSSGCRCEKHNAAVGGKDGSDHTKGDAIDFAWEPWERRELLKIAMDVGVPTIGVKHDCIHISCGLPARVFTYDLPGPSKVG